MCLLVVKGLLKEKSYWVKFELQKSHRVKQKESKKSHRVKQKFQKSQRVNMKGKSH